jgi:hypothetical protein
MKNYEVKVLIDYGINIYSLNISPQSSLLTWEITKENYTCGRILEPVWLRDLECFC